MEFISNGSSQEGDLNMHQSTREHQKLLSDGKTPRIRTGTTVPANAVNLAYTHTPLPSVAKNIRIIDPAISVDNISLPTVIMQPDLSGLLCDAAGRSQILGERLLITNIFKEDTPLPYKARLNYYVYAQKKESSIKIVNEYGKEIVKKCNIKLNQVPNRKELYYVDIYTEHIDALYVEYDAVDLLPVGLRVYPKTIEQIHPELSFIRSNDLEYVFSSQENVFYQTPDTKFGTSMVYVPTAIIEDTRVPEEFYYTVECHIILGEETYYFYTFHHYASVLNQTSLLPTEIDQYFNGAKKVSTLTAKEMLWPLIPEVLWENKDAIYSYSVYNSSPNVRTYTRPDGLEYIYATTSINTGLINVPNRYKTISDDSIVTFSIIIELEHPEIGVVKRTRPIEKNITQGIQRLMVISLGNVFSQVDADGQYYSEDGTPDIPLSIDEINMSLLRIKFSSPDIKPIDLYVASPVGDFVYGLVSSYTKVEDIIVAYKYAKQYEYVVMAECKSETYYYVPIYAVIPQDRKQIKLLPPINDGPFESWYVRIQNGLFYQDIQTIDGNKTYVYFLPEYNNQPYEPYFPYRFIQTERAIRQGPHKIKTRQVPIAIGLDFPIQVLVNGELVEIKAIDSTMGIIDTVPLTTEVDVIEISYYYLEETITYKGFIGNDNYRWHLDLNPGYGHYYDFVSIGGKFKTESSFNLLNKIIYIYLLPAAELDENGQIIPESFKRNCVRHSFYPITKDNAILLGQIVVRPHTVSEVIKVIDSRTKGGGIKPEFLNQALQIEPGSEYYWDLGFFDGKPYMEAGVGIIRLPKTLLKEYGGQFTSEYVDTAVKKYFAWGSLPIIEYVDMPVID